MDPERVPLCEGEEETVTLGVPLGLDEPEGVDDGLGDCVPVPVAAWLCVPDSEGVVVSEGETLEVPDMLGVPDRDWLGDEEWLGETLGLPDVDGEPVALRLPEAVPLLVWLADPLDVPLTLGVPLGVAVVLEDAVALGVPLADGVREVLGLPLCDLVNEGVGDHVWLPVPLVLLVPEAEGETDALTEEVPDSLGVLLALGVVLGLAVALPERVAVTLGVPDTLAVTLGVCEGVRLNEGVSDAVCDGDGEQICFRAFSWMPAHDVSRAHVAPAFVETIGWYATPNPVTGTLPWPASVMSYQARLAVTDHTSV